MQIKKKLIYLIDQSIVSFSNFLLTILILRNLGLEIFGLFSFTWLVFLFLLTLQMSLVISPMLSNLSKIDKKYVFEYYGGVFIIQLLFLIIILLLILVGFEIYKDKLLDLNLYKFKAKFILIVFFSQIFNFYRRYLYSKKNLNFVLLIDFITYFSLFFTFSLYFFLGSIYLDHIYNSMIVSFFLGSFFGLIVKEKFIYNFRGLKISTKINLINSSWLTLNTIFQWFSGNFWVLNAGIILGSKYLAVIRACQTVLNVSNLIFQTLENIFPVKFGEIFKQNGAKYLRNYIYKYQIYGFIIFFIISIILLSLSETLLLFLYGSDMVKYDYVLKIMSFTLPIVFISYLPLYALRLFDKPYPIFFSTLINSIVAITLSNFIIEYFGIYGFIFGIYFSNIMSALIINLFYIMLINKIRK